MRTLKKVNRKKPVIFLILESKEKIILLPSIILIAKALSDGLSVIFFSIQALLLDDKWILFFQVLFFYIYNTTTSIIIWLSMKINGEGVLKNQTNRSKKKQRGLLFTYINHQLQGPTHTFSLQLDRWLGPRTYLWAGWETLFFLD